MDKKKSPQLHTLVEPPGDVEVNIVLIHGLAEDPKGTWTSSSGCFWPRDLLPDDLPAARVLAYSYNADLKTWLDFDDVRAQSRSLFADLGDYLPLTESWNNPLSKGSSFSANIERPKTVPLIFIAHSLGGLICENAIVEALAGAVKGNTPHAMYESTIGIAFFGTPQSGSNVAQWSEILKRWSRMSKDAHTAHFSANMSRAPESLARMQHSFFEIIRKRRAARHDIQICCFFEGRPTHPIGIIVPEAYATLPGYECIGLESNHKELVKFDDNDDKGYQSLVNFLQSCLENSYRQPDTPENEPRSLVYSPTLSGIPVIPESGSERSSSRPTFQNRRERSMSLDATNSSDGRLYRMEINSTYAHRADTLEEISSSQEEDLGGSVLKFLEKGNFRKAEELQRQLVERSRLANGPDDEETLQLQKNLGSIYLLRGLWNESENLLRDVVQKTRELFGTSDSRTLEAMGTLAQVLLEQGKLDEADDYQLPVLRDCEQELGPRHPKTLMNEFIYAQIQEARGNLEESWNMHEKVLEARLEVLGDEHPDTLKSQEYRVRELIRMRRYEEAESLHRRIVKSLDPNEPRTARFIWNLGKSLMEIGSYTQDSRLLDEAGRLLKQTIGRFSKSLGSQHPLTLLSEQDYATILFRQGQHLQPKNIQQRVCREFETTLGTHHPVTQKAYATLRGFREPGRRHQSHH